MLRRLFAFLAILIFSIPIWAEQPINSAIRNPENSTIIIKNAKELSKDYLVLDGPWDYYKLDFVQAKEFYPEYNYQKGQLVTLPHYLEEDTTYATYHCTVTGLSPNKHYGMCIYGNILSCCRIWCNRQLVGIAGYLDKNGKSATAAQSSEIVDLPSDENGVIDIVIQVANHELKKGGLVHPLTITEKSNLENKYLKLISFSTLVMAFLLTLIIYNLVLMIMNRKSFLYFSLIVVCSFFILSVATSGISIFNLYFPNVPFWIEYRLPVLLLTIDISTYIFYLSVSRRISRISGTVLYIISVVLILITAVVPIKTFESYRKVFIIMPLSTLVLILFFSFKFLLRRNLKAKNFLSFDALLYNFDMLVNLGILVAFFYDFVISPNKVKLVHSCVLFKFGILLFGFMQCAIPAFRRYFTNYRIQQSAQRFESNNNLLAKFIPDQVLRYMNAEDVTKIIPGSCHILDAMIVYTEIRYFKQLEESLDPKTLFSIVAEYYKEIAPLIRSSGGYIAAYLHHGCIAVFPDRNDSTIRCAMKMQERMLEIRRRLRKTHKSDISIGVAIHTGKIAYGVIGSEKHLGSITYSSEIDTVIEIGTQTSKTNTKILISEDAMTYCRTYTDCMYEGHFILVGGKNILVYSARPLKEFTTMYDGNLELAEDIDEVKQIDEN